MVIIYGRVGYWRIGAGKNLNAQLLNREVGGGEFDLFECKEFIVHTVNQLNLACY